MGRILSLNYSDFGKARGYKMMSHGIELPPETPIEWASRFLSYADNFLHIVCDLII